MQGYLRVCPLCSQVRVQCFSGTHAIACALFGVLRPGDTMLACSGPPYDTLDEVIGTRAPMTVSFPANGKCKVGPRVNTVSAISRHAFIAAHTHATRGCQPFLRDVQGEREI